MNEAREPINTFDQIDVGDVAVSYHPAQARIVRPPQSVVWMKGRKIVPDGPWYDNGNKTFVGKRSESLPKALAWASEKFGVLKWKRNAMGDYVDASKPYRPLRKRS